MNTTAYRTCHLCEAVCGLSLEIEGDRVVSIRGDDDDVFSHGYICPKGTAIAAAHDDPDRLRTPVRRTHSGDFEPISWDEAFAVTAERLKAVRAQHGGDAVAVYMGNPIVHNYGALLLRQGLFRALGTRNCTSAGSQDTSPRFAASYYLYGSSLSILVPDIDRTDYFLCLGANPRVSNGSFLTAPDIRARLHALRQRGGRLVVVDPRRTETAREADEHVAILPGGDAALLLAMVQTLVADGRVDLARISRLASGWETIEPRLAKFTPESVAPHIGVPSATIRRLAREFAAAPTAAAYSRVGVCNAPHGTLASYATDLLNLAAGRLGEVGGAMFSTPAFDAAPILKLAGADGHGRWRSRVRGLPETFGDLPASILAEEIETPGTGQVRAMLTFAGNPVLSTPNGRRLETALAKLEFMVSIDLYVNETTRHAHIIMPPAGSLTDDHVDVIMHSVAVRNIARWSPPALPRAAGTKSDWQILLELIYRLGSGPAGMTLLDHAYRLGRHIGIHWRPDKQADFLLRLGPYGDRFMPWSRGLNLRKLRQAPHGIDFGPMQPGVARRILHRDRRMHLEAAPFVTALDELARDIANPPQPNGLLLIGRRDLRSNNSWMHNIPELVSGRERCTLLVHPDDAASAGIADGQPAVLESRVHRGEVLVHVSDEMRRGVVSLPHGWGHAAAARWQRTAGAHAGVSVNDWTDDQEVESVVGQSILNGVQVSLHSCATNGNGASHEERLAQAAE